MSEGPKKCGIAIDVALGVSKNECLNTEEFAYYLGTVVYGLEPFQIPKKSDCRLVLLRHLSRRNYVDIHRFLLCTLIEELDKGTSFSNAIRKAWEKVKQKIGEG